MRNRMDPCYWSLFTTCRGQNFIVNSQVEKGSYSLAGNKITYGTRTSNSKGAAADIWLNESDPEPPMYDDAYPDPESCDIAIISRRAAVQFTANPPACELPTYDAAAFDFEDSQLYE
ncbi:unnamed protein product [Merluccius merluccius]